MGAKKTRMVCPTCNMEMNHHAEKLVDPRTPQETRRADAELGGIVEEMHTCPGCGKVESRSAS